MSYECGCLTIPGEDIGSPGDEVTAVRSYCGCWDLNAGPLRQSKLLSCLSSHLSKFSWNSK